MKIGYFAPSYKRPQKSTTQMAYPFVKIVVRESEAEEYKKNGNDIVVCPNSAQGNLCRARNWILDTFKNDYDCIVLMDDDYKCMSTFVYKQGKRFEDKKLDAEDFQIFCDNMANLCAEWGYKFWGVNPMNDKLSYRETTPFSTIQYIGGPFQAFMTDNVLRYDENLNLKEDYDMTLQNIQKYGGCLRVNFAHYFVKQAENVGGCAVQRNTEEERRQFELLQRKWGSDIIRKDGKSKRDFDFNPILKIPLNGV